MEGWTNCGKGMHLPGLQGTEGQPVSVNKRQMCELKNWLAMFVSCFTLRCVWVEAYANQALLGGCISETVVMGSQVFLGTKAERLRETVGATYLHIARRYASRKIG